MTLVQLEYVIALDTYRNFLLAAEKCFVTQPTLSMQILKLEESLGVKLFDRTRKPVVPTEIGIEIIEQSRTILKESQKLKEIITTKQGEINGELKIGIIPTLAPYLLPSVISGFTESYPNVQLHIWEYTTEEILQQLKLGLLDCGILSTPVNDRSIIETPLFYETFVLYIYKSSILLNKKALEAEDINPEDLWLLNDENCMRNQVLNICGLKKESPYKQFKYNTGSVESLRRMVDMNKGVTVLPELAVSDFSPLQLQQIRPFKSPKPTREISMVTHRNFLKRSLIATLEKEILKMIPDEMKSNNDKEVIKIYN
ncbi:MAG: LysR family transcriptional regulator [Flavobacterium sp.]|nr:LysR family transcriptional regulator [Pedobacter sp.]